MINLFNRPRKSAPVYVPDPGPSPQPAHTPVISLEALAITNGLARGQRSQVTPPDMAQLIQRTRQFNAGWTLPRERSE